MDSTIKSFLSIPINCLEPWSIMRQFVLFFVLVVACTTFTMAVDLPCRYDKKTDWLVTDDVYYCDLNIDLDIANENTEFTSLSGEHLNKSTNADVVGFRAYNKTLHYLPQGLEKFFSAEKIEFICIWSGGLKKIQQKDLSPFTKLKYFSVWLSDVVVIEHNLFQFNPEIRYIGLGRNKIKFIVGDVFSHLQHLQTLYLDENICISNFEYENRTKLLELIKEIDRRCSPKRMSDIRQLNLK